MTRGVMAAWMVCAVVSAALPAAAWRWHAAAQREAAAHATRVERVTAQCDEIACLRRALAEVETPAPMPGALATKVAAVLEVAGLSPSSLVSLIPDSRVVVGVGGEHLTRRGAVLTLSPISLRMLGRFLGEWRREHPGWVVVSIDTVLADTSAADAQAPLRAVLRLESATVESQGVHP